MHFVDNIYFISAAYGRILYFIADFTHVFYFVVGGGVHFDYIEIRAVRKSLADLALAARRAVYGRKTVYRPCENLGSRSLTRTARAAK